MKNIFKLILLAVLIIFLYLYIFKEGGNFILKNIEEIKISHNVVDIKEDDFNIIKEFAEGMKTNDYIDVLDYKAKKLSKNSNYYENINYNFEKLLRYTEIEELINNLNNSQAVKTEIIGKSVDQRNIYSLAIGFGEKKILIDAGIHAAEVVNTMYVMKYMIDLINKYESSDNDTLKLLDNVKIIFIPSVNPDGYEACLFGVSEINNKNLYIYENRYNIDFDYYKANANGVDINRNFPSQHGGLYYKENNLLDSVSSKPSTGKEDYYPGNVLGSEPETKALIYWFNKYINNTYAYIDIHSAGRVIYSGKPNLSDKYNENSLKLANIVSDINDYEPYDKESEEVGYGNDGTATDYAAELASGFMFSSKTGRLSANAYKNPVVKETDTGIITLETLKEYTFKINVIKEEYYDKNLSQVLTKLIYTYE